MKQEDIYFVIMKKDLARECGISFMHSQRQDDVSTPLKNVLCLGENST